MYPKIDTKSLPGDAPNEASVIHMATSSSSERGNAKRLRVWQENGRDEWMAHFIESPPTNSPMNILEQLPLLLWLLYISCISTHSEAVMETPLL
jgi:hypothetical protein